MLTCTKKRTLLKSSENTIITFNGTVPEIGKDVFLASNCVVIGDVKLGDRSNVWYGAVIRGDVNFIRIGSETNVQDGCVLHVSGGKFSLNIGNEVTIGHNATVHGCKVSDRVLIGMGAILLDNCSVGENSVIAAGSVVKEGFEVPSGVLLAGVPGKVIRELTESEIAGIKESAGHYVELAKYYILERQQANSLNNVEK